MRSRPKMTVLLRPGLPSPGQTVEVEAHLVSESDTPLDAVSFELTGEETVRVQSGKNTLTWRRSHVHLRAEVPGRPLTVGEHTYKAQFQLPRDLPPTRRGRYAWIDYVIEVRAAIPWWPDRVEKYELPLPPVPFAAERRPAVFVSREGGARAGEIYVELSLASATFEPGDMVVGTVALQNAARQKDVRIALVASERLYADGSFWTGGSIRQTYEVLRWSFPFTQGAPEDGRPYPFQFPIAPDTVPSAAGAISALDWSLEIAGEGLFSRTSLLRAPITIVPRTGAGPRPAPALVPAVGHERRAQSFRNVGGRLGLTFDPERGELRAASSDVSLRVGAENRPDGTLATVAHLAWPALGMGLRVEPASWTDAISPREIDIGEPVFDKRFHVRSRFSEQAKALLDKDVCALLLTFPDVEIDDAGASLAVPLALADEVPLADFVARASQAARAFAAALARVPMPPPLAGQAAAWSDFAARAGGRFEPGSGAIRDAMLGQERMEIATEWTDDGAFRSTCVRVHLGTRIDPQALPPAAQAIVAAIEKEPGSKCAITEERLTLTLDRVVPDPQELQPELDDLARLVQSVRGRGGAGPFRS